MKSIVLATIASVFALGGAAGTTSYTDPAGDSGAAPDVTAVTITDSSSSIQFAFTLSHIAPNEGVYMFMDTDRNAATGSYGSEYGVELTSDSAGKHWYDVTRWDGNTWVSQPASSQMGVSVSGNTYTVRAGRADIGNPTAFDFVVLADVEDGGGNIIAADRVPDGGWLTYELSAAAPPATTPTVPAPTPAAVVPWIGTPTITPAPRAGATVTVAFPVTNKTTGAPLTSGTMMCDPQVNGKVLAHQESFGNGTAKLRFTLPKTAKGKTLKVNLTIRVGSKSAHTIATYQVR